MYKFARIDWLADFNSVETVFLKCLLDHAERPLVEALHIALQILLGITSLLLTLLILLHKGRGGGLSDMFGGGMSSNLGSSGVAERNLNRFTVILGIAWGVIIISLGLMMSYGPA